MMCVRAYACKWQKWYFISEISHHFRSIIETIPCECTAIDSPAISISTEFGWLFFPSQNDARRRAHVFHFRRLVFGVSGELKRFFFSRLGRVWPCANGKHLWINKFVCKPNKFDTVCIVRRIRCFSARKLDSKTHIELMRTVRLSSLIGDQKFRSSLIWWPEFRTIKMYISC